jgi:alpha-beta hydrolase superfamily lysophospholipase
VVTHGYLNSGEMQDLNAIELSRRGYVVMALDMYDHGHSAGNAQNTGSFLNFWPTSLYDAASWMYEQPYVLKDEAGNGIRRQAEVCLLRMRLHP